MFYPVFPLACLASQAPVFSGLCKYSVQRISKPLAVGVKSLSDP